MTTPRIYVACLASYNAGRLHGKWVDATDLDVIQAAVRDVIESSPTPGAEEHAIHDYEGFRGLESQLGEYPSLEDVARIGAFLAEHDGAGAAWISHIGVPYALQEDDLEEAFRDVYAGEWDSAEDFAADDLEMDGRLHSLPEDLRCYFDYEKYVHDLNCNGAIWEHDAPNGKVWIFWSR